MAVQKPATLNLCRTRGDTFPFTVVVTQGGTPVNLTGFGAIIMTVDPSAEPLDAANNLFTNTGVITDAAAGKVTFTLSLADSQQTPNEYFHDMQWIDGAGAVRTFARGTYLVEQDISK